MLADQFSPDDLDMAKLPNLSPADVTRIRAIEHLPPTLGACARIDFDCVEFPAVDFSGFYFGVAVAWDNATFRGSAMFDRATFVETAAFNDTVFNRYANFEKTTFQKDA